MTILPTYNPKWKTLRTKIEEQRSALFAEFDFAGDPDSVKKFLEKRTTDSTFQDRLSTLGKQSENIELARFKTLDECIDHYEAELTELAYDHYTEYARNNGTIRDEHTRSREQLLQAFMLIRDHPQNPNDLPAELSALITIQGKSEMTTAREIHDQFNEQFNSFEDDFLAAMKTVSSRHNVTPLQSDDNPTQHLE